MKKLIYIIVSLIIVQTSFGASFKELQEVPYDSLNSIEMKIWFPVKETRCQVHLRILDSKMQPVRELIKKSIKNGYYNIFWDKKDDSGNYVPEGSYKIAMVSCKYKRLLPLVVKYADGENALMYSTSDDLKNPTINLDLKYDSLNISIEIVNARMNHTATLFTDSLNTTEQVSFQWTPEEGIPSGKYFYKMQVNDFEHLIPFRFKR